VDFKSTLPLAALTATLFCGGGSSGTAYQAPAPFHAEVTFRSARNIQTHAAVLNLVANAQANHIDTLVVAAKQDEDDEMASGTVFYASAIAPQATPGFDALQDVITEAHKAGIKVKAWVPQFHDQVAFYKDPTWRMQALVNGVVSDYTGTTPGTAYFVNSASPAVQAYELSILEELVTNYAIDGLVLDWIRFDGWNMDMSAATRAAFLAANPGAADPINIDFTTDSANRRSWQDWRTTQIGNYVATVRSHVNAIKPNLPLGIFILPPEFVEVGQDAAKFKSSIDFVCPMCYWVDWGFPPSWVTAGVLKDTAAKVGTGVKILPTIGALYPDADVRQVNTAIRAQYPSINTLDYFQYWTWNAVNFQTVNTWRGR
jgi:uncharacterized lipoprotein YddW (UPF0748 family)